MISWLRLTVSLFLLFTAVTSWDENYEPFILKLSFHRGIKEGFLFFSIFPIPSNSLLEKGSFIAAMRRLGLLFQSLLLSVKWNKNSLGEGKGGTQKEISFFFSRCRNNSCEYLRSLKIINYLYKNVNREVFQTKRRTCFG